MPNPPPHFLIKKYVTKIFDENIYLAFLDLKSNFDSVPRDDIWEAFIAKNVPKNLAEAIKSKYQEPKEIVRLNRLESNYFNILKGVKQGESLSTLLFMDEVLFIFNF